MSTPIAPPRTALSVEEAAQSLGVSKAHFRRWILPTIGTVQCGKLTLIPLTEIQAWLDAQVAA